MQRKEKENQSREGTHWIGIYTHISYLRSIFVKQPRPGGKQDVVEVDSLIWV